LEPPSFLRGDGKRPDGTTITPWYRGHSMIWDFTCPDTLVPSHLRRTMFTAGAAASSAENCKITKYADLEHTHILIPVAIEKMGVWEVGAAAAKLVSALGRRCAVDSRDPRSTFVLRQPIDIAIRRGNALSVLGTLGSAVTSADLLFMSCLLTCALL